MATTDFGFALATVLSLAIQSDGKIVAGGVVETMQSDNAGLVRYNTDGSLDNTFSGDGKMTVDFKIVSVAIQSDGKIVAGGAALARYNTQNSLLIVKLVALIFKNHPQSGTWKNCFGLI